MSTERKLSLPAAILININIMLGAGVFINTVELAQRNGLIGGFLYPFIGLLIVPLILVIAQLLKMHPAGGFYTFGQQEISPFAGFISTWSYFIAKLASAMLMIHVSTSLIMQIFPVLAQIGSVYFFDTLILSFFVYLNTQNLRTGSRIQMGFLFFKLMPVLFVIALGIIFFAPSYISTLPIIWSGVPSSIPLVLYAAMGFEAICALSNNIEDSQKNGPKSIFISVSVVMTLVFLFQLLFYTTLGNTLAMQTNYLGAFPALLGFAFPAKTVLVHQFTAFFHLAIALSALGGCYGILYSNNWNLYILAQNKHVFFDTQLIHKNKHAIPIYCLFAEWLVCMLFLMITFGKQLPLQQTAALGTAFTYFMCVIALWFAYRKSASSYKHFILVYAGFFSCAVLVGCCIRNFLIAGIFPLLGFFFLITVGIIMYYLKQKDVSGAIQK